MTATHSAPPWPGRGLYPLADVDACGRRGLDVVETAAALMGAGVPILQLRAKGRPAREVLAWSELLLKRRDADGPRFVVNDRADIAEVSGADGVHLGQGDLPVEGVRAVYPKLRIGLSTHDERQFSRALDGAQPSYVAIGPVLSTTSKRDPEPCISPELLRSALSRARLRGLALVAIGGLTERTVEQVAPHADLLAVISSLLPDGSSTGVYSTIERRARDWNERILRAQI